jgi:hypothetical protein
MISREAVELVPTIALVTILLAGTALGQPPQAPEPKVQSLQGAPAPATAEPAWHAVTGPDASFTAQMPAAPIYSTREVRTAAGSSYTQHQYMLEQGETAYVIHTAVYPSEVTIRSPRVNLQGGLDEAAKSMDGGKWASIDWKTRERLTAADAVGTRGAHEIRALSLIKGRQMFTLTYLGPAGSTRSPEAERFLASLRLGD